MKKFDDMLAVSGQYLHETERQTVLLLLYMQMHHAVKDN